jgi:hypothetical protein
LARAVVWKANAWATRSISLSVAAEAGIEQLMASVAGIW